MNLIPQQRKNGLGGLLLINGAILFVLAIVALAPFVSAQGFRSHGNYHAVSGKAPGSDSGVICVIDENNQQLIAFTYDPNTKRLVGIGGVDLARDAQRFAGGN